jgi:hypothetical protein
MDHVLAGSLTAVQHHDIPDPQLWFSLISEVYEELATSDWGPDFIDFRARFTDRAAMEGMREAAEEFVRYAEDNGGIDLVRQSHEEGVATLAHEFEQLLTSAATTQEQQSEFGYTYDEDAWYAFLPEIGAQWNGDDESWDQWVDWFVYHARDRGLTAPALAFVEYATAQPDRIAVFAAYGIDLEPPHAAADSGADTGDPDDPYADVDTDAWMAFLTHVGTDWDGDEATWQQWVDWFMYHAGVQGLTSVAAGFVEYAEGEPDKIAFFARYGIDIAAAATPVVEDGAPATAASGDTAAGEGEQESVDTEDVAQELAEADADPGAAARRRVEAAAAGSQALTAEHLPLLTAALGELFTDMPAAALLSDEQLRQVLEEIAQEYL